MNKIFAMIKKKQDNLSLEVVRLVDSNVKLNASVALFHRKLAKDGTTLIFKHDIFSLIFFFYFVLISA